MPGLSGCYKVYQKSPPISNSSDEPGGSSTGVSSAFEVNSVNLFRESLQQGGKIQNNFIHVIGQIYIDSIGLFASTLFSMTSSVILKS